MSEWVWQIWSPINTVLFLAAIEAMHMPQIGSWEWFNEQKRRTARKIFRDATIVLFLANTDFRFLVLKIIADYQFLYLAN